MSYSLVAGQPQDFHIVTPVKATSHANTSVTFDVTYSTTLTPVFGTDSGAGLVDQTFSMDGGVELRFHTDWVGLGAAEGERRSVRQLRCTCHVDLDVASLPDIQSLAVEPLDDVLTVASLASRWRTSWFAWVGDGQECTTRFYRGFFSPPEDEPAGRWPDTHLIPQSVTHPFIQSVVRSLRGSEYRSELVGAVVALTDTGRTLHTHYLALFAALEELTLKYRRIAGMEFVLDGNSEDWRNVRKMVKKAIKEVGGIDEQQRKLIYEKIPELNRVGLRTVVGQFCADFTVEADDLWPLFGGGGLSEVRNRLIHGGFSDDLFMELACAKEHLSMFLERCVLRVLDWDVNISRVSPEYLRRSDLTAVSRLAGSLASVRSAFA